MVLTAAPVASVASVQLCIIEMRVYVVMVVNEGIRGMRAYIEKTLEWLQTGLGQ